LFSVAGGSCCPVALPGILSLNGSPPDLPLGFWILVGVIGAAVVLSSVAWYRRSRSETALRFSQAKFAGIIAIATDAIVSIDERQIITDFNRGAESIFGYRAEEAIGRPLDLLIPKRLQTAHRAHVAEFAGSAIVARRMGEREGIEIVGRRKGGEEFPAEASISKMHIGDRAVMTVVLRDVTARRRAEEAEQLLGRAGTLLASSLDYQTTLHSIVRLMVPAFADWCVLYSLDDEGVLHRLDAAAADPALRPLVDTLMQWPTTLGGGHPAWRAVEMREVQLIEELSAEQLGTLPVDVAQLDVLRQLGMGSAVVAPLVARGRTLGAIGFYSGTPARYGRHAAGLALELGQRAAMAMDNARLYREAQQASKARDEVLSVVSHDLGNPLSAIFVNARLLERELAASASEGPAAQHVTGIRRAAEQMQHLIRDLLDVQRIEEGRLVLDPGRYTVTGLVAEALERIEPLSLEKSLHLVSNAPEGLPAVRVDRERIMQVFGNVLGNAVKFTPSGGGITIEAVQTQGGFVSFRVVDTGPGITAAELPHVFDRYWQAHKTRRLGAGLGLAIARGIVEAHGGGMEVTSEAGCGTAVSFTVPLADT
jgi:PAS domain S-box-containing protein